MLERADGTWPPPPGWPPEVPQPLTPPGPPVVHPPVPVVYEPGPAEGPLSERLLERRIVLVSGALDAASASDASARLLLLDAAGDDPIDLLLSCADAELEAAMALADTVELVGPDVRALCTGQLGGPAVLPFAVASTRRAQPHATFRLAEPRFDADGRAGDLAVEVARHEDLLASFQRRLAAATGQPVELVADDCRRRRLLDAEAAVAYGLVDEIARRRPLHAV